jgi:hypothetical protein
VKNSEKENSDKELKYCLFVEPIEVPYLFDNIISIAAISRHV